MKTQTCFIYDKLEPGQMLQLLADTSERVPDPILTIIRVQTPSDPFDVPSLIVPDALPEKSAPSEPQRLDQLTDTLFHLYHQYTGHTPKQGPIPRTVSSLANGIIWLLVNGKSAADTEPPVAMEDEYLLIARNLTMERAHQLLADIRFHATAVKFAGKKIKTGSLWLYHVLDDRHRRSTFQSALAGGLFHDCHVLDGFWGNGKRVFLHETLTPDQTSLDAFCRIIETAPWLFTPSRLPSQRDPVTVPTSSPIAAIDCWPQKKRHRPQRVVFISLTDVTFSTPSVLDADGSESRDVVICDLASGYDMLDAFKSMSQKVANYNRYPLQLRSTRHLPTGEKERQRIEERLIQLEYQLAYVKSTSRPRPYLLRFPQQSLPALAEVIRSQPRKILNNGQLRYAYQADTGQAWGFHYLFVHTQQRVQPSLDPLAFQLDPQGQADRFWLDPFWAQYYYQPETRSMVFVPEDTTLFPYIHEWDRREMDHCLYDLVMNWYRASGKKRLLPIPDNPIYLFEGRPDSADAVQIRILDMDRFHPIHSQLEWLNDNIVIYNELDTRDLISQMAEDITLGQLANHFRKESHLAMETFETSALEVVTALAEKLNQMMAVLSEEVDQVVSRSISVIEEIRQLKHNLAQLIGTRDEMAQVSQQLARVKGAVGTDIQMLYEAMEHLESQQVGPALEAARQTRHRIREQVEGELERLQWIRTQLVNKLKQP